MTLAKALVLFAPVVAGSAICSEGGCQAPGVSLRDDDTSLLQFAGLPSWRPAQRGDAAERRKQEFLMSKLPPSVRAEAGRMERERAPYSCPVQEEECHMGDGEGCDLRHMSGGRVHSVYPGNGTACLNSSAPYYFLVKPGDPGKLMITLESGGACWDQAAFDREEFSCNKEPDPLPWMGVLEFTNWRNPYHGYTVVRILYCSGDLYVGDTEMPWGPGGAMVQQRGYRNTQTTLDWTLRQFPRLQKLAIVGYSAGAVGLQLWADSILRQFEDRHASAVVYADSFAGILYPPGPALADMQGRINAMWKVCNQAFLSREAQVACSAGQLTWQGNFAETMQKYPHVGFASVSSKVDWVQVSFNTFFFPGLTAQVYYRDSTLQYKVYARNDNFRVYFLNGCQHLQLPVPTLHTATPLGVVAGEGKPALLEWIRAFEGRKGHFDKPPGHVCVGDKANVTSILEQPPSGTTWCDVAFL